MTRRLTANKKALNVVTNEQLPVEAVDVLINGRRVWSVHLPEPDEKGRTRLRWPKALQPYLRGRATITLSSSATGETVAEGSVRIGRAVTPIEVRDSNGRWLAMNKWSRLGPSFEGNDAGVQERLLSSAQRLVGDLQDLGYPVFIVGGTLLGAMRAAELLPHDDDIDLAWVCRETNPLDISLASMTMERQLAARGYTSIRLSMAHLQVTFFDDDGRTDHYVDIFTGFFMNGEYGQPFALRGQLDDADLEPIGTIQLNGKSLPAPARPEAWLEFAYGPNWLVPDPSFKFVTPRSTVRRFENWFGVFNRGRVYWEKEFEKLSSPKESSGERNEVDHFLRLLPATADVVCMGSGDGGLAERIALAGHSVLGVDYSYEALRVARSADRNNVEFRYLNFNDGHALLEFGLDLLQRGKPTYFFASHLLAAVPKQGRANIFLFLNLVLRDGQFLYATFDTEFSRRYRRGQPDTWHYPLEWLQKEAAPFGLAFDLVATGRRTTRIGRRSTATVLIRRDPLRVGLDEYPFEQRKESEKIK